MESGQIEILLEKYFDALTTTAEEQQLKAYFSSPGVAPHLEQYRPVFGYFSEQTGQQFSKSVPLKTKKHYAAWLSVAAAVALLSGMFFIMQEQQPEAQDLGTYDDPEVAFRETQKALNMLSENVNVGVAGVNYLGEYEKTKKTIFKE